MLAAFLGAGRLRALTSCCASPGRPSWTPFLARSAIRSALGKVAGATACIVGTETSPLSDLTLDLGAVGQQVQAANAAAPKGAGIELVFAPDYKVFDGRFANASWLQELPDPITKVTWDNAAQMSPATAKALGVQVERDGDKLSILNIEYRDRHIHAPAIIVPGHADDCVTLTLGYGRDGAERVARGIGFNAGALRDQRRALVRPRRPGQPGHRHAPVRHHPEPLVRRRARARHGGHHRPTSRTSTPPSTSVSKSDGASPPPSTSPWTTARCTTSGAWPSISASAPAAAPAWWPASPRTTSRWSARTMVVGREMQWLRIDRYYSGELEDPEVVVQPLACVHCETAPCEYVCPVNATVHSDEGLNEMVYNRCVGTRYCSNNCPYKVRRFNFLRLHQRDAGSAPPGDESRGHRAQPRRHGEVHLLRAAHRAEAHRHAHRGRRLSRTTLQTACQQACPRMPSSSAT